MAETKANNLHQFLQDLADTIRSNDGTVAAINPQDYSSRIQLEANKDATPSSTQDVVITPSTGKYGLKQVTVKKIEGGTISTNPGSAGATILDSSISVASTDSTAFSYTTAAPSSGNYYTITETPSLNRVTNPTYKVSKAGYISSPSADTGIAIQAGTMTPKNIYVKKAALGAGVTGNIEFTPSVSTTMTTISKPATGTDGTDYFSITGSGTKSGTVTGTASVSTAGFAPSGLTGSGGSASGTVKSDDKKYIAKGGLSAEQVAAGSASMDTTTMAKAQGTSDFYITLSTTAGSARAKTTSDGYNKSGATSGNATVNVTGNNNKLYIKAGTVTPDDIAPVTTINNLQANASASSDNVKLTDVSGKPETGFYIKATGGSSAKTVSGTSSEITITAGYVPDGSVEINPTIEVQKVSHGQYYSVPTAVLNANATQESAGSASIAMSTVAEDASKTSPYYVTLNTSAGSAKGHAGTSAEGYTIEETADQWNTTSIEVTGDGTKKYIKDAGTPTVSDSQLSVSPSVKPTPVASATGNVSLTAASSQPSSGYYIKVTGGNSATTGSATSGETSYVTWATGYTTASTTSSRKTITSTATASAEANSKDQYYTIPGSTRSASLSNNTAAKYEVTAATTVATSSTATDYYVDISKTNGSVTPRASTTAGYIDNSYTDGTATAVSVTGPDKVYIKAASTPAMGNMTGAGDVGVDIYEVASASQDTNLDLSKVDVNTKDTTAYYFKVGAKGTSKTVKSGAVTVSDAGYITAGTKIAAENKSATVTANEKVEYVNIKKAALGADVSTEAGSASMSSTTVSEDASKTSSYYVNLSTTAGKATGSASVSTEGYAKSETATSTKKDVAVAGNGNKFYITPAVLGASSSQDTAGSASNSATGMVTSSTATDHYVTLSTTAGKAKGSASTTTAGYTSGATATQSGTTSIAVTGNGTKTYIRDATISATVSNNTAGSASMSSTTVAEDASKTSPYHVDLSTTAGSVKAKASVTAEGYATSADDKETAATSVSVTGNGSTYYIPQATIQGGVSGNITFTPSVSTNMATITQPSTGTEGTDYFSITGSGSKSGTVTGTSKATGSGYITKDTVGSTGGSATGSIENDAKKYVAKATLGAEQTQAGSASMSSMTVAKSDTATDFHVDLSTTAGKARGKTGTAGYLPASVVSSATDVAVNGNNDKFYIPAAATPTLAAMTGAGDVGIDIYEVAEASQDTNLDLTKVDVNTKDSNKYYFKVGAKGTSKTVKSGKVNVATAGYMTAGDKIAAENKSATVTANEKVEYVNLNKGVLVAEVSNNSAGSASMATTTMDTVSSSDYYVTLSTTAGSVKAKAKVNTEGYVKSETAETSATSVSVSGNGNKLYIKPATASKTDATASASVNKQPSASASTSVTGMVTTTTNTGYSVSASASAASGTATASVTASSASVTSGYSTGVSTSTSAKSATSTEATKSASDAKYIQKGVLGAEVSNNSGGSASMSTDTMVTSSTATPYHVDLTTSAGSVKAKAKVNTEGYVKSETAETSATSVAVSGNGDKIYIYGATHQVSGSVTNATATTTVAPGNVTIAEATGGNVSSTPTTTKPSSGKYIAIQASAAANSTGTTSSITGSGTASDVVSAGYDPGGSNTGPILVSGTATAKTSKKDSSVYYAPITTTDVVEKAGTLNTTAKTYTQGKVTVDTAGWIDAGDKVAGATFANSATNGVTYKDISSTSAAPVLVTQDYLYINKGYTDNVKISLAKLVPDGASADLASGDILTGKSAYDNDGKLVAGSMPAINIPDPTMSFNATTKKVSASGSWTKGYTTDNSYSNSYTVTLNDARAVTGEGSCEVTGGGLSQSGNSGGGLSLGTATAPTVDIFETAAASQDTNISLDKVDVGDKDTTNYPYYFKVSASSSGGGNVVTRAAFSNTVTRADIKDKHTAGYITAKDPTTVIVKDTSTVSLGKDTITATAANGSKTEYVKLKGATVTATAGTASASASIVESPSASVSQTGMDAGISTTATSYYFTGTASSGYSTASASATGGSTSVTEGYTKGDTKNGASSGPKSATSTPETDTKTVYLKAAGHTVSSNLTNVNGSGNVYPGTVSIADNNAAVANKTRISVTPSTATTGISKYYIASKATAAKNTGQTFSVSGSSSTGAKDVVTAGYCPGHTPTGTATGSGTATANVQSKDSSVYYSPIPTIGLAASGSVEISGTQSCDPGNVTVAENNASVTGKTRIAATPSTNTTDINKYYIAVKPSAAKGAATTATPAVSGTASASVSSSGYGMKDVESGSADITSSGSMTINAAKKDGDVHYIPLASAALSNYFTVKNSGTVSGTGRTYPKIITSTGYIEDDKYLSKLSVEMSNYVDEIICEGWINNVKSIAGGEIHTVDVNENGAIGEIVNDGLIWDVLNRSEIRAFYNSYNGVIPYAINDGTLTIDNNETMTVFNQSGTTTIKPRYEDSPGQWHNTDEIITVNQKAVAVKAKKPSSTDYEPINIVNGSGVFNTAIASISVSGLSGSATSAPEPGTLSVASATATIQGKVRIATNTPQTSTTFSQPYYMAIKPSIASKNASVSANISGQTNFSTTSAGVLTNGFSVDGTFSNKSATISTTIAGKDGDVMYIPVNGNTWTNVTTTTDSSFIKISNIGWVGANTWISELNVPNNKMIRIKSLKTDTDSLYGVNITSTTDLLDLSFGRQSYTMRIAPFPSGSTNITFGEGDLGGFSMCATAMIDAMYVGIGESYIDHLWVYNDGIDNVEVGQPSNISGPVAAGTHGEITNMRVNTQGYVEITSHAQGGKVDYLNWTIDSSNSYGLRFTYND